MEVLMVVWVNLDWFQLPPVSLKRISGVENGWMEVI